MSRDDTARPVGGVGPVDPAHPVAAAAVAAVRAGDVDGLHELLAAHPWLAGARLGDDTTSRTLLHVVTDWPGHPPRGAQTVRALVAAGADVDARFAGPHRETPLHWAASTDDVAVLDALLDAGADLEAAGAVIGGGSPLADARGFRQWRAAARLVERGAHVDLFDAATLGFVDRLRELYAADPPPSPHDTDLAFWSACHGGRLAAARFLHEHGADVNTVPPWDDATPLDAATDTGAQDLLAWLRAHGARSRSPR